MIDGLRLGRAGWEVPERGDDLAAVVLVDEAGGGELGRVTVERKGLGEAALVVVVAVRGCLVWWWVGGGGEFVGAGGGGLSL